MKTDATRGLCQSCGMPLRTDADHGTDRGGGLDPDYCRRCFHEGAFLEPHVAMSVVIERYDHAAVAPQPGGGGRRVRGSALIPKLKRWRDSTP